MMNTFTELQWVGPVLAVITFATIGFGHVMVRSLHARFGTRPAVPLFLVGGLVMLSSLAIRNDLIAGGLGITGITLVWDGIEIYRQEKRVQREGRPARTN